MYPTRNARRLASALREAGERVFIIINGKPIHQRAVVQNAGKNFMRKYDDEFRNKRDLGSRLRRDKIAFIPYFDKWCECGGDITVIYRGKKYIVLADSIMKLGEESVYIWALLREFSAYKGDYYDSTIG